MSMKTPRQSQGGFTIIELMIATLVFSLVLILITVGVLSFTRSYYKGINQSNTQRAARDLMESASQAIQFSGDKVSPLATYTASGRTYEGYCIGSQRYSFLKGWQQVDSAPDDSQNQSVHVLILDKPGSCGGLPAQNLGGTLTGSSTDILAPRMRLSKFVIAALPGASNTYQVTVRVVYGDNDLLNNPTADNASCRVSISGSQYCAQSELTTTVKRRINN